MQDDSEHPQTPETQRALAALHAAVASKVAAGRTAYDAAQSKIRVLATLKENLTQLAEELALAGEDHSGSAKPIPFSNLGRGLPVTPLWGEKPASASVKANCHDDETLELYNVSLRAMECLPGDLILLFDLINTDSDCHVKNLSWVVQNPRGCTVRLHADSNQVPPADVTVMGGVITLPSQWWDTTVTLLLRWTAVRSASETSVHWRKVNVAISNVHARWIPDWAYRYKRDFTARQAAHLTLLFPPNINALLHAALVEAGFVEMHNSTASERTVKSFACSPIPRTTVHIQPPQQLSGVHRLTVLALFEHDVFRVFHTVQSTLRSVALVTWD